jgi:hypothetical protein
VIIFFERIKTKGFTFTMHSNKLTVHNNFHRCIIKLMLNKSMKKPLFNIYSFKKNLSMNRFLSYLLLSIINSKLNENILILFYT